MHLLPSANIVNDNAFASFAANTPFEKCGAVVAVAAMADEHPYTVEQFKNRLAWAIAHEIGHLIIRLQNGVGWKGGHRDITSNALMAHGFPRVSGLSHVTADEEEISKINLTNRASVKPMN